MTLRALGRKQNIKGATCPAKIDFTSLVLT